MRRNRTGTEIDKLVRDLSRDYPHFGVKDQADLWEKLASMQVFFGKRRPPYPGRLPAPIKSITEPDKYVLLAASDGSEISDFENGLSTRQCFDYLLDLAERHNYRHWRKTGQKVWFLLYYGGYDINMMLRGRNGDVPREVLRDLHEYKSARWYFDEKRPDLFYAITWMRGKKFSLSLKEEGEWTYNPRKGKREKNDRTLRSITLYDVGGFFQMGFVKACAGWGLLDGPEGDERRRFLEEMKAARGSFSQVERETVRRYNALEVKLIADMGKLLWEAHEDLGLNLNSMHGAGATARAVLEKYGVVDHLSDGMPLDVRDRVFRAYFGGRIQLQRVGRCRTVYGYDINSAYPYAMTQLPSLRDARWYRAPEYDPEAWAIWHVRWDLGESEEMGHCITPFPFRTERGKIVYLRQGEGWYWNPEVAAALRHFPGQVEVLEGVALRLPYGDERPFAYVAELYERRRKMKLAPEYDVREKVIKLGLNGGYGKLAEGAHSYGRGGEVTKPRFQNYVFAGLITSITRAKMLEAAMIDPYPVIAFATDCLFTRVPLPLETGDTLGGWSGGEGRHNGIFVQPGFYKFERKDGSVVPHTRGFMSEEVDWDTIEQELDLWRGSRPLPTAMKSRRFIGLGAALAGRLDEWCTWVRSDREITPFSTRSCPAGWDGLRLLREANPGDDVFDMKETNTHGVSVLVEPIVYPAEEVSAAYRPKHELNDDGNGYLELEQYELNSSIEHS
jgi:hypothetical protein